MLSLSSQSIRPSRGRKDSEVPRAAGFSQGTGRHPDPLWFREDTSSSRWTKASGLVTVLCGFENPCKLDNPKSVSTWAYHESCAWNPRNVPVVSASECGLRAQEHRVPPECAGHSCTLIALWGYVAHSLWALTQLTLLLCLRVRKSSVTKGGGTRQLFLGGESGGVPVTLVVLMGELSTGKSPLPSPRWAS